MLNRIVVVLLEDLVAECEGCQFIQFVIHNASVVVGINVALFLPLVELLDKGAGFVAAAIDRLLQGAQDVLLFALLLGFLGEDDRIGNVRMTFGRNRRRIFHGRNILTGGFGFAGGFLLGGVVFVDIDDAKIIDVCYHSLHKKHRREG